MGKRSIKKRQSLAAQFAAGVNALEARKEDSRHCPHCGETLDFPEARIAEGQYHPSNIDAAMESYGYCSRCDQIAHPGNRGHYGSLDVWGSWICYGSCPKCSDQ